MVSAAPRPGIDSDRLQVIALLGVQGGIQGEFGWRR